MIPYSQHVIDESDIAAVVEVLRNGPVTQGPAIASFEERLSERLEVGHVVAFSSGTAALHGAAAACGLGTGDKVATSALTFVASANCIRYVGAMPVVIDIDPETLCLDPKQLPADLSAFIAVHYSGYPMDLADLPVRPKFLIEDATHALGAHTPYGPIGNCAHSDLCVFSFHPSKLLTTAEGGAVTTNNERMAKMLRSFRNHGMVPTPEHGLWSYDIRSLGFNYRISDIQAALGESQLNKLDQFVQRRRELALRYREKLAPLPVLLPPVPPPGFEHAYHLFAIRLDDRQRVYDEMHSAGIHVQVHYVPLYRHTLYGDLGVNPSAFPATEAAYSSLISLPLHPALTEADHERVINTLTSLVQ